MSAFLLQRVVPTGQPVSLAKVPSLNMGTWLARAGCVRQPPPQTLELKWQRDQHAANGPKMMFVNLEPIREVWIHSEAFAASRLSMMRIMARRMNAATVCVAFEVASQATVTTDPRERSFDDPLFG